MNRQIKSQDEDEIYDHDSFFNIWRSGPNLKDGVGMGDNFSNDYNEFGGLTFSQASFRFSNNVRSDKEVADFQINGNQFENISLTDLLKTNCSHHELNSSIRNMAAFDKVFNQNLTHNQQTDDGDGLQLISNRKLQNRYNSKRARERKKQQWQQLKETINQLQLQNRTLRKSIEKQFQNKNIKSNKKYCKKCQSQIKDNSEDEDQNKYKISDNQTQILCEKQKHNEKNSLQKQYLRVFLGKQERQQKKYLKSKNECQKKYLYEQQNENDYKQFQKWVEGEGKNIWKKGKQYIQQKQRIRNVCENHNNSKIRFDTEKQSPLQVQFQQVNFFGNNQNLNKPKKQKNVSKDKKWMGKVWIALSIIMMVIGVQLHGLEGNGDKTLIRVNDLQANNWVQKFKDPNAQSLTIKMKTKLPNTFIKNQKQIENQSHFKWNQKWNMGNYQEYATKTNKYRNQNEMQAQQRQNRLNNKNTPKAWFERINFQSQQQYNRSLFNEQEQQSEIKIDKDLLFSIQAQLDDIGMYI